MQVPEDQWDIVYDHHPALVTQTIFDGVQELKRFKNARMTKGTRKVHPLSGKLICADCGSKMVLQGKEPWKYYVCSLYATKSRSACTNHSIRMEQVERVVYNEIKKVIQQIKIADDDLNNLHMQERQEQLRKDCTKKLEIASRQLEENKNMLLNLYKDKLKGVINDEQYGFLSEGIQLDIEKSERDLESIELELAQIDKKKMRKQHTKDIVNRFVNAEQMTREMVNSFIQKIKIGQKDELTKQQAIEIEWNI